MSTAGSGTGGMCSRSGVSTSIICEVPRLLWVNRRGAPVIEHILYGAASSSLLQHSADQLTHALFSSEKPGTLGEFLSGRGGLNSELERR